MATIVTWDTAYHDVHIVLSNGDLTAERPSYIRYSGVRATHAVSSGKWYWEVTLDHYDNDYIGVGDSSWAYDTQLYGANQWSYQPDRRRRYCNTVLTTTWGITPVPNDGDIISVALDMDDGKIWWAVNGVWQDVTLQTDIVNGLNAACTGLAGTLYPICVLYYAGHYQTVNFGASAFAHAAPTGFEAYGDSVQEVEKDLTEEEAAGQDELSYVHERGQTLTEVAGADDTWEVTNPQYITLTEEAQALDDLTYSSPQFQTLEEEAEGQDALTVRQPYETIPEEEAEAQDVWTLQNDNKRLTEEARGDDAWYHYTERTGQPYGVYGQTYIGTPITYQINETPTLDIEGEIPGIDAEFVFGMRMEDEIGGIDAEFELSVGNQLAIDDEIAGIEATFELSLNNILDIEGEIAGLDAVFGLTIGHVLTIDDEIPGLDAAFTLFPECTLTINDEVPGISSAFYLQNEARFDSYDLKHSRDRTGCGV